MFITSSNFTILLRCYNFYWRNLHFPNLKLMKDFLMQYVWNQRRIGSFWRIICENCTHFLVQTGHIRIQSGSGFDLGRKSESDRIHKTAGNCSRTPPDPCVVMARTLTVPPTPRPASAGKRLQTIAVMAPPAVVPFRRSPVSACRPWTKYGNNKDTKP